MNKWRLRRIAGKLAVIGMLAVVGAPVGIDAMLGWVGTAAGSEVTLRVAAPDVQLDTLQQDISYQTQLGSQFQLAIGGSQRFAKNGGFSGLNKAYVSTTWRLPGDSASLQALVGRTNVNWSLWNGDSVVLSSYPPGWDQIQYIYTNGPVTVEKTVGQLSGDNRYLLGHRLSLRYGNLTGTLGETVVCSGNFAGNIITLLPWPFYWTQWIGFEAGFVKNDDVNVFAFAQGLYANPNGFQLGAELIVDDMPHWFGVNGQIFQVAGQLHAALSLGSGTVGLDYTRVNNFTYSFQDPRGDYTNQGYVLGFPQGPDGDEFRLRYQFPRGLLGLSEAGLTLRRHGEGRMGDIWEPAGVQEGLRKQFLAGIVESSQLVYAAGTYPLWQGAEMYVRFGVGPVQNAKNRAGYNKVAPDGQIGINLKF